MQKKYLLRIVGGSSLGIFIVGSAMAFNAGASAPADPLSQLIDALKAESPGAPNPNPNRSLPAGACHISIQKNDNVPELSIGMVQANGFALPSFENRQLERLNPNHLPQNTSDLGSDHPSLYKDYSQAFDFSFAANPDCTLCRIASNHFELTMTATPKSSSKADPALPPVVFEFNGPACATLLSSDAGKPDAFQARLDHGDSLSEALGNELIGALVDDGVLPMTERAMADNARTLRKSQSPEVCSVSLPLNHTPPWPGFGASFLTVTASEDGGWSVSEGADLENAGADRGTTAEYTASFNRGQIKYLPRGLGAYEMVYDRGGDESPKQTRLPLAELHGALCTPLVAGSFFSSPVPTPYMQLTDVIMGSLKRRNQLPSAQ